MSNTGSNTEGMSAEDAAISVKLSRLHKAILALCMLEEATLLEVGSLFGTLYISAIRALRLDKAVAIEGISKLWDMPDKTESVDGLVNVAAHKVTPVTGNN